MTEPDSKSEFILAAGEYGFYLDQSKGIVSVMVGPYQKSLTANTEAPMIFDSARDRLVRSSVTAAQLRFPHARQGQYIVLENPAPDLKAPPRGSSTAATELQMGRKVVIPGPAEFPLWPMQRAVVIDGHQLRTDQYLIVQVYDEEEAVKNKGLGFTLRSTKPSLGKPPKEGEPSSHESNDTQNVVNHPTSLGSRFVVKGTVCAFYIPPTGYEVVQHEGQYVRTAVSLEELEYCTLLDEGGDRRIEIGPQVVFPEPTEIFVTDGDGKTKFRAIELDEIKGVYVKVTTAYTEGEGERAVHYKPGDELFITGKDQRIYFPRTEHALVSYDGVFLYYGVAIPNGEGRYVLSRKAGNVALVEGPKTFLPNPIEEVVVRRVLTEKEAALLFPGNQTVASTNRLLRERSSDIQGPLRSLHEGPDSDVETHALALGGKGTTSFERGGGYTPPRTITLGSNFDGAVRVSVWPGFALMLVNGKGKRRVVQGPATTLLEYDETPHRFALSSGTPKSPDRPIEGVYLQTAANSVTDVVEVETRDLCKLQIKLSYKVNFEGDDPEKWFAVANYVGLLSTTLRSILRNAAKKHGVLEFLESAADIVRDIVLGKSESDGKERAGKVFTENAMRVYDVDVLDVSVEDDAIGSLITQEQLAVFRHSLHLSDLKRSEEAARVEGDLKTLKVQLESDVSKANAEAAKARAEAEGALKRLVQELQDALDQSKAQQEEELSEITLRIAKAKHEQDQAEELAKVELEKQRAEIDTAAKQALLKSLGDIKLPEALMHLGEGKLLSSLSENLSIKAMLGGDSLVEVLNGVLKGTPLADSLMKLTSGKPPA